MTVFPSIVSGMTSSPVAVVSQLLMVTSPLVVVHVRSLRSAAWSGITVKVKSAISVGFFMPLI